MKHHLCPLLLSILSIFALPSRLLAQFPDTPAVTREYTLFVGDLRSEATTPTYTFFGGSLQGDAVSRPFTLFGGVLQSDAWTREASVEVGACAVGQDPPTITGHPSPAFTCVTGTAIFSVAAVGEGRTVYLWQIEAAPPGGGAWFDLADGPLDGFMSVAAVEGSSTGTLTITGADPGAARRYRVIVSNACGSVESDPAQLAICAADFTCDGAITVQDFLAFLTGYSQGDPRADFNGDGRVAIGDFLAFVAAYAAGCE